MTKTIEVRAVTRGYFNGIKEEGEEFTIPSEDDAGSWMARKDGQPFTRKPANKATQLVVGDDGVVKAVAKTDDTAKVLTGAGSDVKTIPDANLQGPETVIGTPTPGFDAKAEAEKAEFVARAKEKADEADAAEAKRKAK